MQKYWPRRSPPATTLASRAANSNANVYVVRYADGTAVLLLKNQSLRLSEIDAPDAAPDAAKINDGCRAWCVDWYGNSRPLFLGTRVFALMGYELVEGRVAGGKIAEVQRVNYAPAGVVAR